MKYVPGPEFGQFSGKQGNTVASRNRFGTYLRNRVVGVNPNTDAQQGVRNRLAAVSAAWAGLTSTQRAAWNDYAAGITLFDPLGQPYQPTGQNAFVSVNQNTFTYSGLGTITTDVPTNPAPAALLSLSITGDTTPVLSASYTATPLAANTKIIIEATGQLSPGISFIKRSLYRQIFVSAAAAASPANILAAWTARYGTLIAGKQVALRAYVVTADGQASAPITASHVIEEA